ncbi:MAG: GNAT family N-acetyltransferase [Lentisphaerae bacterium]|jgi:N-acetylglutamate synthase-like GNAT family acetyltransferase|nr:GNAT family N-acetyltransferase [Lentisphaerota bacterium]
MDLVADTRLSTGETMHIWHWSAPEEMPARYRDYIVSSFMLLGSKENYFAGGWVNYIASTTSGVEYPEIKDHWLIAEVDGVCAGRLWFAYAPKTGRGNFGNIATEPNYRRRGILTELMKVYAIEAEKCSDMKMLCCITGKEYAADCYRKFGFETTDGAKTGIMCYCKNSDFNTESAMAFIGKEITKIRPGVRSDQYDIDKFLLFQDAIRKKDCHNFCGYATWFAEFRLIYQEVVNDRGVVFVAENKQGTIVAYAYALITNCTPFFNFVCHPAYLDNADELLKQTAEAFHNKFHVSAHFLCEVNDADRISVAERSGAVRHGILPGYMAKRDGSYADVMDFTFLKIH